MTDNVENHDDIIVKGDDGTSLGKNIRALFDGTVWRLATSVIITGFNSVLGYSPKLTYDIDDTTTSLTGSFSDVYSYTGTGRVAGFLVQYSSKSIETKVLVDGNTLLQISADDIDQSQSNSDCIGLSWEPNKKVLKFYPRFPVYFNTDFKIQAKETSGEQEIQYSLVSIEKVS